MSDTYGAGDAPLVPGRVASPDVNAPAQTGGLADQWRGWMSDPHNRAAMMQFGIALSQPIGAGQNALGQIGSAFGQAGEASDRITAEEDKQREAESKQELRTAQAGAQESKAGAAADRARYQQDILGIRRQALDYQDQSRIAAAYNRHLRDIALENKDIAQKNFILPKNQQQPLKEPLTEEQFAARYRGMGATGNVAPVAAPPVQVDTPEDIAKLPSGTRYVRRSDGRTGTVP